jgi:hypothetical protein
MDHELPPGTDVAHSTPPDVARSFRSLAVEAAPNERQKDVSQSMQLGGRCNGDSPLFDQPSLCRLLDTNRLPAFFIPGLSLPTPKVLCREMQRHLRERYPKRRLNLIC